MDPPIPTGAGQELAPQVDQETVPGSSFNTLHRAKSDVGNAQRLLDRYGNDLLYVPVWRSWHVWDSQRWRRDDLLTVERMAKDTIRQIARVAVEIRNLKEYEAWARFALQSENTGKVRAMIQSAQELFAVTPDDFDRNHWKLNVLNGTLDLRTGRLKKHDREDFITKLAPVTYDPAAKCPTWLKFLDRAMRGNAELIEFIQRALGYSLTGDMSEKVLFIVVGPTDTGKSKFLGAIHDLLGQDYAQQMKRNELMVKRDGGGEINEGTARLRGVRFATAIETSARQRLDEEYIKQVTGGDPISARNPYEKSFQFWPTHKIWMATNDPPKIKGTDDAIWNRVRVIEFLEQIPRYEQDRRLADKFRAEQSGILRWMVEGCLKWRRDELGDPPENVRRATDDYRRDQDLLGRFIVEFCNEHDGAKVKSSALFAAYQRETKDQIMSGVAFAKEMKQRGYEKKEASDGNYWLGIELADLGIFD